MTADKRHVHHGEIDVQRNNVSRGRARLYCSTHDDQGVTTKAREDLLAMTVVAIGDVFINVTFMLHKVMRKVMHGCALFCLYYTVTAPCHFHESRAYST